MLEFVGTPSLPREKALMANKTITKYFKFIAREANQKLEQIIVFADFKYVPK